MSEGVHKPEGVVPTLMLIPPCKRNVTAFDPDIHGQGLCDYLRPLLDRDERDARHFGSRLVNDWRVNQAPTEGCALSLYLGL